VERRRYRGGKKATNTNDPILERWIVAPNSEHGKKKKVLQAASRLCQERSTSWVKKPRGDEKRGKELCGNREESDLRPRARSEFRREGPLGERGAPYRGIGRGVRHIGSGFREEGKKNFVQEKKGPR